MLLRIQNKMERTEQLSSEAKILSREGWLNWRIVAAEWKKSCMII
jgi:hypothetical protein